MRLMRDASLSLHVGGVSKKSGRRLVVEGFIFQGLPLPGSCLQHKTSRQSLGLEVQGLGFKGRNVVVRETLHDCRIYGQGL